jgi:dTMP kinase
MLLLYLTLEVGCEVLRFAQDDTPLWPRFFARIASGCIHFVTNSTTAVICFTIASMPRFPFITFEGSEGCGKSTQIQRLAERLERAGVPLLVTREPGGTPIGETIKDLLQFAPHGSGMTAETELLLFEASRSQLVRETIRPALERGVCVISDRFFDSTTVYQGVARRLDARVVEQLNAFAVGDCVPDVTFLLDMDAATARARMLRRVRPASSPDRMEQEPTEFYEQVREAYRQLARREAKRIHLIDAVRDVGAIADEIWQILSARFPELVRRKQSEISGQQSAI